MSANVETMFSVRQKPWHGLGTIVQETVCSSDALHLAGLDWEVVQRPVLLDDGTAIPNFKANVRSTDGKVLGIVGDRYKVVQNTEAFTFTDELIGEGVKYETAGSLQEGRKIWLLAKMPSRQVLGDEVEPYLCFSNSHDGSGSIRVCMTPIRVVCNNTLNLALREAKRHWSMRHQGDIKLKLQEARTCLGLADNYMCALDVQADRLANTTVTDDQIQTIVSTLFPISVLDSVKKQNTMQKVRDEFMMCYLRPDIAKFLNTGWGVVNAMSDMITHASPKRRTPNFQENNWARIMDGPEMLDRVAGMVMD